MSQHRGESNMQYDGQDPQDSDMSRRSHRSQAKHDSSARTSQGKARSSQRAHNAPEEGQRSPDRAFSRTPSFEADIRMPSDSLRREAMARSMRTSQRVQDEQLASPGRTAVMDPPLPFRQSKLYDEPLTGQIASCRPDFGHDDNDGGLCSEDERDVKMLQKKRRQRERRNLTDDQLHQRLREAQSELEYNALAAEIKRRDKVARVSKVFGGVPSSSKATRKMLDEAGWGRRK